MHHSKLLERLNQYMYITSATPELIEENPPPLDWLAVDKVDVCDLLVSYFFAYVL
ncbi:hypothetical protein V6Z12_D08G118700 [Gossypium hirsutum]